MIIGIMLINDCLKPLVDTLKNNDNDYTNVQTIFSHEHKTYNTRTLKCTIHFYCRLLVISDFSLITLLMYAYLNEKDCFLVHFLKFFFG